VVLVRLPADRRRRAVAAALALLTALGCDSWLTRPSYYAQLDVITRDQSGSPMVGVPLVLYTGDRPMGYASSDASGHFLFTRVPVGVYGVKVERQTGGTYFLKPGDSDYAYRDQLSIGPGARDSLRFVLERCAGTLRATILDENGMSVPGAFVRVYTTREVVDSAFTGDDGRATFSDVPCVITVGIQLGTSSKYTVTDGEGSSVFDGLKFTTGQAIDVVFHVRRQP
jgi:hypothetical protein